MDTKLCNDCDSVKSVTEFHANKARPDGLQAYCKECKRSRDRKCYKDNKEVYVERNSNNRRLLRDEINDIKASAGCRYCDETDFCCLEFHHHSGDKENTISRLVQTAARLKALAEVKKCHVVCRNCHAKLHADRKLIAR